MQAAIEEFAGNAAGFKILAGPSPDPAAKQAAFHAFQDLYDPTRAAVDAFGASRAAGAPT